MKQMSLQFSSEHQ